MSFISNVPFVSSMFNVSITLFDERTYSKVLLLLLYFQFEHDRAFLILLIVMSLLHANPSLALFILKLIIRTLF